MGGDGQTTRTDETQLTREAQTRVQGLAVAEVDEYGFPLDGYDYSQHLASIGGGTFMNSFGERMAVHVDEDSGYTSDMLSDAGSVCSAPDYDLDGMLPSITLGGQEMSAELREALELLEEADKDDTLVYSGSGGAPPPAGGKRVKGDAVTVAAAPAEAAGADGTGAAADGSAHPDSRAARKKRRPKAQNVADFEMLNDDFMLQAAGEKDSSNWEIVNPHEIMNDQDMDSKFGLAGGVAAAVKATVPQAAMSDEAAAAFIEKHQAAMLEAASQEAAAAEDGTVAAAGAVDSSASALDAHIAALLAQAGEEEEDIDELFAAQEAEAEAASAGQDGTDAAARTQVRQPVKQVRLSESGFDWDAHVARLMANARGQMEDLDTAVEAHSDGEDSDDDALQAGGASESKAPHGMPVNGHGTTVSAAAAAAAAAQARGYRDSQFFKQFVAQYDDELIGPGISDDEGSLGDGEEEEEEEEEDMEFESLEALQAKYGLADVEGMGMEMGSDDEDSHGEEDDDESDGEETGGQEVAPGGAVKIGDKVAGYGTVIQTPLHGRSMAGASALLEAAMDEFSSQRVSIEELFAGAYRGTAEEHAAAKKAAAAKKRRAALASKAAAAQEEEEEEEESDEEEEASGEEGDSASDDSGSEDGSDVEEGDADAAADAAEEEDEVTELAGGIAPSSKPVPYGFGVEDAIENDPILDRNLFRPKVKAQWDVDTVISTYSNLDNHPQQLSTRGPSSVATGSRRRRGPNSVASRGTDSGIVPHLLEERSRGRRAACGEEEPTVASDTAAVDAAASAAAPVPPGQSMAFSISLPGAAAPPVPAAASTSAPVAARAASPSAGSAEEAGDEVASLPSDHPSDGSYDSDDGAGTMMSSQMSRRGETPEERKQRKAAVKAVRKARRQHKAAMRAAFKEQEQALLVAQNKAKAGAASAAGHAVFRIG